MESRDLAAPSGARPVGSSRRHRQQRPRTNAAFLPKCVAYRLQRPFFRPEHRMGLSRKSGCLEPLPACGRRFSPREDACTRTDQSPLSAVGCHPYSAFAPDGPPTSMKTGAAREPCPCDHCRGGVHSTHGVRRTEPHGNLAGRKGLKDSRRSCLACYGRSWLSWYPLRRWVSRHTSTVG